MKLYHPLLLSACCLSACSVHLIANYDADLVQHLHQVQEQINTLLLQAQAKQAAGNYQQAKAQYIKLQASLITLISQQQALTRNKVVVEQLQVLLKSLKHIQHLHQQGFTNAAQVKLLQDSINDEFTTMYNLQNIEKQLNRETTHG